MTSPRIATRLISAAIALLALGFAGCTDLATSPDALPAPPPQYIINGADDFVHEATAAIMVYVDPNRTGVFE